jgi:hypothetical protein
MDWKEAIEIRKLRQELRKVVAMQDKLHSLSYREMEKLVLLLRQEPRHGADWNRFYMTLIDKVRGELWG